LPQERFTTGLFDAWLTLAPHPPHHPGMDRRRFLVTWVSGALAAPWPARAHAAGKVVRIGFLSLAPGENTTLMKALEERLHELGYVEGRNMLFDYRSAEGRQERLAPLAAERGRQ
jgi:putative ABC transport system substrate-binding protein